MKMIKYFALCAAIAVLAMFSIPAYAEIVAAPPGMEWIGMVLQFLMSVPYVGPILVKILEILSLVSVGMTALSAGVAAFIKGSEGILKLAGAHEKAKMIAEKGEKLLYWLKYFSMFNAKK
jgi:hypothetical protein